MPAEATESTLLDQSMDSLTVQAEIHRGGDFMAFGFDSLWMMSGLGLARVDASNNSVMDNQLDSALGVYRGVAVGEGAVWVPDCGGKLVYKVDPHANTVVKRISAECYGSEGSIGVGEGAAWVVTEVGDRTLTRFNAESGAVEAKISLPSSSAGVTVDYGSVWVTGDEKSELYQINPKTNTITSTIPLHRSPRFLASGEGSVWVLTQGDGTVQRVDGQTGKLTATIETGAAGSGGDITTGGGYVWMSMPGMPVAQIDPKTNTLIRKFTGGFGFGDAIR
jgi:streptogramin lyase